MTLRTPNASAAIDYVRAQFANYDSPETFTVCGTVAPGRDSSGIIPGSRDVLFIVDGNPKPARFTVWHDEVYGGELYGEW